MVMPLVDNLYQIAPALLVGIASGLRKSCVVADAAALGAKMSFIVGAAVMLFSENRWWPVTWSMFDLVSWVLAGWIAAAAAYGMTKRLKGLLQRVRPTPAENIS
jgi:hypothetical protein